MSKRSKIALAILFSLLVPASEAFAQSMGQEQIQEKRELDSMKSEINDIKSTIDKTVNQLNDLAGQMSQSGPDNEIHLLVKETKVEVVPGKFLDGLTYNGKLPGPTIRAREGVPLKVVLHNQSKRQTSLVFAGLILPQSVSGLPRKKAGAVNPGEIYAYQFSPQQSGTFWYHPQVNHLSQKSLGLYGALIVEPSRQRHAYDRDFVLMLGQASVKGTGPVETCFTINGNTGSTIQPMELRKGERIRLRLINTSNQTIPMSLTGHKLEIVSINGSDALEPHVFRDTISLSPSDRVDAEFTADNPGVWALASEIPEQASNQGAFPGGIACVVRYIEYEAEEHTPPPRHQ